MVETGTATNVQTFNRPITALVRGECRRLLALGDVPGHSPSYLTVNAFGQSQWESFGEVQIIDLDYLPVSADALAVIANSTRQATVAKR